MKIHYKSLLIPITPDNLILIQDRLGHKPPPWGFFGGSVEAGESMEQALIRETKEELNIEISESQVNHLGEFIGASIGDTLYKMQVFTWAFDGDLNKLTVLEGEGMKLLPIPEALELMEFDHDKEILLELQNKISS